MKQISVVLLIAFSFSGCFTTKIMSFGEAASHPAKQTGKRDFLVLYNQNNQYELHDYSFRNDTLEGQVYIPKMIRSTGIMVFTSREFVFTGNMSDSITSIPNTSIVRIQEVKHDLFRSVAFAAGVAIVTFGLWSAGNLIISGML